MTSCETCGDRLSGPAALCGRCDVPPAEEHPIGDLEETQVYTLEQLEAIRSGDGPVENAAPPVLQPIEPETVDAPAARADGPLNIALRPTFDLHSAPGGTSPAVNLLLEIEPSGGSLVDPESGPVAHVVLALDLSASMNETDKYPVLCRAIERMIDDLQASLDGDVLVSVVTFAKGAEVLFRDCLASELVARDVLAAIDASPLRFTRYTDLAGALNRAGRIAYDSHRANRRLPIRVYALTDGRPQDMERAEETMKLLRRLPADVHGLAFGRDADVAALQSLISGGRGGTVKTVRPDTLSECFGRIAEVAQRVVAKRAILDVELSPGTAGGTAYRFRPGRHSYGEQAFRNGRWFSQDLGVLESGRRYSLLFEVRLPPTLQDESEIGRVTLRVPGEGGADVYECLLSIARHEGVYTPTPDSRVAEAHDILVAMDSDDPHATLKALHARRRLYVDERRDPHLIALLDRAIEEVEQSGSLSAMSSAERAALRSHTQSVLPEAAVPVQG